MKEKLRGSADEDAGKTRRGHNEGSITERKNKTGDVVGYQARVSVPGGRRSRSFKTEREAKVWMRQALADALRGRLAPRRPPTLTEYLEETWLPSIEDKVKTRTHVSYTLNAKRIPPWLGSLRLDELKPAHFQRFYTELSRADKAPRTVRQIHMTLHKACEDALRLDLATRNPTEGVLLPRIPKTEMHWYDDAQLRRLFEETDGDRFHALWLVLGTLGLRLSEALGLKWRDIDWRRGTIAIRRTLQRDRKGGGLVFTELKNEGSRRTLTLTARAIQALRAHQDRQEFDKNRAKKESVWFDNGLLFCTAWGQPLDQGRIHQNWTTACTKAGLPRYRVHDLRHSVASNLIAGGMGLLEVAHMLGHRNATMVTQVYGHVAPADHGRAAALMERLLEGRTTNGG